jgi:outer membrane translocation and assembly module TamA
MAKKERLGTDPFKGGSLGWIQDTREEKKAENKPEKKNKSSDYKASKRHDVKTSKRLSTKTSKRLNVKTSKRQDTKKQINRKRHTIYLSAAQSKKLRVYAAANDIQMSEVVEKLINDNL